MAEILEQPRGIKYDRLTRALADRIGAGVRSNGVLEAIGRLYRVNLITGPYTNPIYMDSSFLGRWTAFVHEWQPVVDEMAEIAAHKGATRRECYDSAFLNNYLQLNRDTRRAMHIPMLHSLQRTDPWRHVG